jgi:hypothetical protein
MGFTCCLSKNSVEKEYNEFSVVKPSSHWTQWSNFFKNKKESSRDNYQELLFSKLFGITENIQIVSKEDEIFLDFLLNLQKSLQIFLVGEDEAKISCSLQLNIEMWSLIIKTMYDFEIVPLRRIERVLYRTEDMERVLFHSTDRYNKKYCALYLKNETCICLKFEFEWQVVIFVEIVHTLLSFLIFEKIFFHLNESLKKNVL